MFVLAQHTLFCPPESLFSFKDMECFARTQPPPKQEFVATWGDAKGLCVEDHKIVCCGHPHLPNTSKDTLAIHPCRTLIRSLAHALTTHTPEQAITMHTQGVEGSFAVLIWNTKTHHRWVYSQGLHCFTNAPSLSAITPHPYTLAHEPLWIIPNKTICSSQNPGFLTPTPQTFAPLDPLKHLARLVFKHAAPMSGEPISSLTFLAEGIGLCVSRMIKDLVEHTHHTQTHISPLTHTPHQPASQAHPCIILPSLFSPHAHTLQQYDRMDHTYVVAPKEPVWSDTFSAPLLYPLHQWVQTLSLLHQEAPLDIDGDLVFPVVEQLAPFLPLLKKCYRLYLGRHLFAAFARVCAFYDQSITRSHAMHYPAGELKHGPLALVDEHLIALIFCPYDDAFHRNLTSVKEILARRGHVLAFTDTLGAQILAEEGVQHITLHAHPCSAFITLAWLCIHRLMFLIDV